MSKPGWADLNSASLTPASGRQDHTTSPYAATSFVSSPFDRSQALANPPCNPRLVPNAAASTASRPAFVTIAKRPSVGRDGESSRIDLGQVGTEIFFGKSEKRLDSPGNSLVGQITTRRREAVPCPGRGAACFLAMPTGRANARPMTGSASSGHAAPQAGTYIDTSKVGPGSAGRDHTSITAKGRSAFPRLPG